MTTTAAVSERMGTAVEHVAEPATLLDFTPGISVKEAERERKGGLLFVSEMSHFATKGSTAAPRARNHEARHATNRCLELDYPLR